MTDKKPIEHNPIHPIHEKELGDLTITGPEILQDREEPRVLLEPEVSTVVEPFERPRSSRVRRYIARGALGLLAVGGVAALTTQPGHVVKEVEKAAPITLWGAGGSEVLWQAGLGMMLIGEGRNIGNPLTLRKRWGEVRDEAFNSPLTKAGLTINTLGALAFTGFVVYGGTKVSPDLWPSVAGFAGLDLASTVAIRAPIVAAMKDSSNNQSKSREVEIAKHDMLKRRSIKVRHANLDDIDRLADIDLELFRKAYGQDNPSHKEVADMLKKRYLNNPDWMFVSEVAGQVEGFVSAFRTDVPLENFVSWENSTANGTLDGKVNPKGKYAYVTNMTIKSDAVRYGAEKMLLASLFANGIESGLDYAYFVSRVPYFKRWLNQKNVQGTVDNDELQQLAEEYVNTKRKDGARRDPELRMYEKLGYSLERTVADAFQDDASLNFGVIFKVEVPPTNKLKNIKPIRLASATVVRQLAKHPRVLERVFK